MRPQLEGRTAGGLPPKFKVCRQCADSRKIEKIEIKKVLFLIVYIMNRGRHAHLHWLYIRPEFLKRRSEERALDKGDRAGLGGGFKTTQELHVMKQTF